MYDERVYMESGKWYYSDRRPTTSQLNGPPRDDDDDYADADDAHPFPPPVFDGT